MIQRILDAWNAPRLTRTGVDEVIMSVSGIGLALIVAFVLFLVWYGVVGRKK